MLGLQEVDRNQPRSQHADLTAIAAEAMGATEHRFVAALSGTPGAWSAATDADSRARGVRRGVAEPLPGVGLAGGAAAAAPCRLPHRWPGGRRPSWVRDEPRVGVVAERRDTAASLRVVNTHLSFLRGWNVRQLRVL